MTQTQPAAKDVPMRDYLNRLGENSALHSATLVLDTVAHSSVGLGEVLQDYAHQAGNQLRAFTRASVSAASGSATAEDAEALRAAHFTLKAVASVLGMTPAAMERNKAEIIGEKDKFARADIVRIGQEFLQSTDIARLLESEDSGELLVDSDQPRTLAEASL